MSEPSNLTHEYLKRYPAEAATVLEEQEVADSAAFLVDTPSSLAARVMDQMLPWVVAECLQNMSQNDAADRLQQLSSYRAIRVLRLLPESVRNELVPLLPASQRKNLERQMEFPGNTVGAWMDIFVPTLPETATVEEALVYARRLRGRWYHHVCLMARDGVFRGMVSLSRIISAPNNRPLQQLVDPDVQPLSTQATLTSVRFHSSWDHAAALPVINPQSRIEGLLRQEQLREGLGSTRTQAPLDTGWATGMVPLMTSAAFAWTHCLLALALGEADHGGKEKSHDR
jgi:magnesium transporter